MGDATTINTARILLMSRSLSEATARCAQLTMAGWQVVRAVEQIEALTAVRSQSIDLALLHMPVDEMVDTDLPNVLRRVSPAAYVPVMIIAGDPAEEQRCRFLHCGADDVISEATSQAEMVARIGAMLRIKELNDQLSDSRSALQRSLHRERKLLAKFKRDNAHLRALCTTDPLTHVQNVRSFRDIFDHEFKIAKRYNQHLSLLMLDVDHFKVVNDTHGHPSGDYVLKELAVILTQSVRESDVVARTGGEEFCLILPRADRGQGLHFAERIRKEVYRRQFIVYGQDIHVTVSLGLATFPGDAEITEPDHLIYCADQALLMAKETGRDRVVGFRDLDQSVRLRLCRQYHAPQADPAPAPQPGPSEELQPA